MVYQRLASFSSGRENRVVPIDALKGQSCCLADGNRDARFARAIAGLESVGRGEVSRGQQADSKSWRPAVCLREFVGWLVVSSSLFLLAANVVVIAVMAEAYEGGHRCTDDDSRRDDERLMVAVVVIIIIV